MLETIIQNPVLLVPVLLAVLGLFSAIARITPNTSDNKWADTMWKWVNKIGLRGGPTD